MALLEQRKLSAFESYEDSWAAARDEADERLYWFEHPEELLALFN